MAIREAPDQEHIRQVWAKLYEEHAEVPALCRGHRRPPRATGRRTRWSGESSSGDLRLLSRDPLAAALREGSGGLPAVAHLAAVWL